jgi:hypothetical protein
LNQETFECRFTSNAISPSIFALDVSSEKGMSSRHARQRAEKRMTYRNLVRSHLTVVKQDSSRIAAVSHEFLGRRTLGAPDSQAMWRRIFLAELDQIFAHLARLLKRTQR